MNPKYIVQYDGCGTIKVGTDRGLELAWPHKGTEKVLLFGTKITLFRSRLEAQDAIAATLRFMHKHEYHWAEWYGKLIIVQATLATKRGKARGR